ncbi:MAG: transcriptional regulator [Candidatus Odinarchaeota archaeon]|nr:transcriptional regulator [Candidatus Odinarchaeota archaeon]
MLERLERIGTLRVLLVLLKKQECNIITLKRSLKISQTGLYSAINTLIELGLVESKMSTFPREKLLKLTEKGRKVAEYAEKIKEVLEES